jgi:hypothetical protein
MKQEYTSTHTNHKISALHLNYYKFHSDFDTTEFVEEILF